MSKSTRVQCKSILLRLDVPVTCSEVHIVGMPVGSKFTMYDIQNSAKIKGSYSIKDNDNVILPFNISNSTTPLTDLVNVLKFGPSDFAQSVMTKELLQASVEGKQQLATTVETYFGGQKDIVPRVMGALFEWVDRNHDLSDLMLNNKEILMGLSQTTANFMSKVTDNSNKLDSVQMSIATLSSNFDAAVKKFTEQRASSVSDPTTAHFASRLPLLKHVKEDLLNRTISFLTTCANNVLGDIDVATMIQESFNVRLVNVDPRTHDVVQEPEDINETQESVGVLSAYDHAADPTKDQSESRIEHQSHYDWSLSKQPAPLSNAYPQLFEGVMQDLLYDRRTKRAAMSVFHHDQGIFFINVSVPSRTPSFRLSRTGGKHVGLIGVKRNDVYGFISVSVDTESRMLYFTGCGGVLTVFGQSLCWVGVHTVVMAGNKSVTRMQVVDNDLAVSPSAHIHENVFDAFKHTLAHPLEWTKDICAAMMSLLPTNPGIAYPYLPAHEKFSLDCIAVGHYFSGVSVVNSSAHFGSLPLSLDTVYHRKAEIEGVAPPNQSFVEGCLTALHLISSIASMHNATSCRPISLEELYRQAPTDEVEARFFDAVLTIHRTAVDFIDPLSLASMNFINGYDGTRGRRSGCIRNILGFYGNVFVCPSNGIVYSSHFAQLISHTLDRIFDGWTAKTGGAIMTQTFYTRIDRQICRERINYEIAKLDEHEISHQTWSANRGALLCEGEARGKGIARLRVIATDTKLFNLVPSFYPLSF
ncbi:hypothetical protein [Sclerotinia sclerotiorum reovirus 1]|nr:hypothetical protein [Sclerotinia sclerotiorum reovirus 1]